MRVNIPKDNPNMTCQAVPLQSQSMVSNQQDHHPPSSPDATPVLSHRPPPPTRTHHETPTRSWSTARTQYQRDTGSVTTTTISPYNKESATLDPPPRPPMRDPQTTIHGAASEALDLRVIKQKDSRGIGMEKRKEKLEREALCVMCHKFPLRLSVIRGFCQTLGYTEAQCKSDFLD
ncbi:unnamed protein product [Pleuronectes platessa]|uniref:Uncharacterized protein n=1 Tax=Pleuronectes platessa TaxID=8262 RepID=A0A9N7U8Z6_PLEPL|nr:unnamed protein product [Pleuronectes platessa]